MPVDKERIKNKTRQLKLFNQMNPDPKIKYKKKKIDWTGFAVPKQAVKLSSYKYAKLKRVVHKLDGYQCVNPNCTETYTRWDLTLHHIIPRSRIRLDTIENSVTLCLWCHMLVEDKIIVIDFNKVLKLRGKRNRLRA